MSASRRPAPPASTPAAYPVAPPAPPPTAGMPAAVRAPRVWTRPHATALLEGGRRLLHVRRRRVQGTLYRAVYARYLFPPAGTLPEPLYHGGSLSGRRFTPRGGPAGLYLGFDPATLPAELRMVVFADGVPIRTAAHDPIVTVSVSVDVRRVLDLTDAHTRDTLDLDAADLTADWETEQEEYAAGRAPMPATQLLALAAHASGLFAGIMYPSARTDFGTNLVVFPDRLVAGGPRADRLEVVDSTGRYAQRLP